MYQSNLPEPPFCAILCLSLALIFNLSVLVCSSSVVLLTLLRFFFLSSSWMDIFFFFGGNFLLRFLIYLASRNEHCSKTVRPYYGMESWHIQGCQLSCWSGMIGCWAQHLGFDHLLVSPGWGLHGSHYEHTFLKSCLWVLCTQVLEW